LTALSSQVNKKGIKADVLDLLFPVVRAEVLRALFHHTQREMYCAGNRMLEWAGVADGAA
jgi:hypothetical protein